MATHLSPAGSVVRVVKGSPDADELAALLAVLLSRVPAPQAVQDAPLALPARWRRSERAPGAPYATHAPRGWRAPAA